MKKDHFLLFFAISLSCLSVFGFSIAYKLLCELDPSNNIIFGFLIVSGIWSTILGLLFFYMYANDLSDKQ